MVSCLVLGGSTHSGFLSDAILQLIGIPLLLVALWRMPRPTTDRGSWVMLALCLFGVAMTVLQLIPLPPLIWTRLPSREAVAATYGLIDRAAPWLPLSVTPKETWLSALSMIPPLALLLGIQQLGYGDRRRLTLVVLAVGMIAATMGLLQVAQGPASPLRFFPVTNFAEAVGFFANRNHFAALLYCLMLLIAAWTVEVTAVSVGAAGRRRVLETALLLPIVACFAALVVLVSAQAMTRSRAGLGLTIIALVGGLALALSDRRTTSSGISSAKLIAGAIVLAITFVVQLTLYRLLERFSADPLDDARVQFAQRTFAAAKAYLPFGAGMGSFLQVYPMFERPQDALVDTFANRAHNDIFEFWLEAGLVGAALMLGFVLWLGVRSFSIWRQPPPGAHALDHALARASTVIVVLLLLHSLVDYPLRTEAMLAVMSLACALLIPPPRMAVDELLPADELDFMPRRQGARSAPGPVAATAAAAAAPIPNMPWRLQMPTTTAEPVVWPSQPADTAAAPAADADQWPAEWRKLPAEPAPAPPITPANWGDPPKKPPDAS